MAATMLPADWLHFLTSEYLDGFIRDGGAAVKFVVPMDADCRLAMDALGREAARRGYVVAQVDASETRVHLVHELFFRIAQQVPWQEVADRALLALARERGYREPSPGLERMAARIAAANGVDPDMLALDLRGILTNAILREPALARDYRVAMTQLCLGNLRSGPEEDERRKTIVAWLTGQIKTVGPLKQYEIHSPINRANARHHLQSMLRFLRFVGYPGLVISIEAACLAVPKNPRNGTLFYGRAALLDFYESMREFIDETDRLEGCLILVVPSSEFLSDDPHDRGMAAYDALKLRIYDEVHDARYVNPMASLIRLSSAAQSALRGTSAPSASKRSN